METPAEMHDATAAVQVSHIIHMTASALKSGSLAEGDYDLEVEDTHGNKVKANGTLRMQPYQLQPPPYWDNPLSPNFPEWKPPEPPPGQEKKDG